MGNMSWRATTLVLSPDGRKLYITFWNQAPGKPSWEDGFLQQFDVPHRIHPQFLPDTDRALPDGPGQLGHVRRKA
jgi:hypothetical protein